MKILFSPSELKSKIGSEVKLNKDCFIFPEIYEKRLEIVRLYDNFLKGASDDEISRIFGLKNLDDNSSLRRSIFEKGCIKAALRYTGVAFEYLKYASLNKKAQEWVDKNVLIFSNLFGVFLAGDLIPEYKLKQGEKFTDFSLEKFYKEHFSDALDALLESEDILDLRAGYYEKFYEVRKEYLTFKFIKNGKVISHHAKAYRGTVVREIAINNIKSKDELMRLNFENLHLIDMKTIGLKNELLFEIG